MNKMVFTLTANELEEAYNGKLTLVEVYDKNYIHKRCLYSKAVRYEGKAWDMYMEWLHHKYPNGDIVLS